MAYTHFRYIAYEVPTIAKTTTGIRYGLECGSIDGPPVLRGGSQLFFASDDAKARIKRLIGLMTEALGHVATMGDDDSTLKIFIAPEFYFRPNNDELAYNYPEYKAIKKILRDTILEDSRFDHWLVIPGTIIWIWENKYRSADKRPIVGDDTKVYMNTTLPIKKGLAKRVIEKAEASGHDGIPSGGEKQNSTKALNTYYKSAEKIAKHYFEVGGLNIGLEICLEHGLQILKKSLGVPGPAYIDLQLLTAGGIDMGRNAIVARPGGFILRNDGTMSEGLQPFPDPLAGYNPGADDRDAEENDGTSTYVPATEAKDHTNMRKIIKYREPVEAPKKEEGKEEDKGDEDKVKSLKDSTPGVRTSSPYLIRMTVKRDFEIASGTKFHLPVTGELFSTNASQRLRIFGRHLIKEIR
jgi:hypothetical protein